MPSNSSVLDLRRGGRAGQRGRRGGDLHRPDGGGIPDRVHTGARHPSRRMARPAARFHAPAESDPARPSYFYGPARSDLRYIRQVAWSRWQHAAGSWGDLVGDMLDMAEDSHKVTGPPAVGLAIGLIVAVPLAAVLAVAAGLTHEVVVDAAPPSACGARRPRCGPSTAHCCECGTSRCAVWLVLSGFLTRPICVPTLNAGIFTGMYGRALTGCCAGSAAAVNPCPPCCCSGPHGGWMRSVRTVPASSL